MNYRLKNIFVIWGEKRNHKPNQQIFSNKIPYSHLKSTQIPTVWFVSNIRTFKYVNQLWFEHWLYHIVLILYLIQLADMYTAYYYQTITRIIVPTSIAFPVRKRLFLPTSIALPDIRHDILKYVLLFWIGCSNSNYTVVTAENDI